MSERWVSIAADGGEFRSFVVEPEGAARGAIVVIQEIFGINEVVRGKCRWLAREGFLAIAPDLFWRIQPGIEITDRTDAEWTQAMDYMRRFNIEAGVADLQRTIDYVRAAEHVTKVGAVGYCLGGLLAYLTAYRTNADAVVGYYGVSIDQRLSEAANVRAPLMLHIAGKDGFVPAEAQAKIKAALEPDPRIALYAYAEQDHAFTREGGKNYDAHAAELADARTIAFFRQHIGE